MQQPCTHPARTHPAPTDFGCRVRILQKKKRRPLRPQTTLTMAKVHNPCHTQCGLLLKRYWLSLSSWHTCTACKCSVGWHISRAVCELSAAYIGVHTTNTHLAYIQHIHTYIQHIHTCSLYASLSSSDTGGHQHHHHHHHHYHHHDQ